MKNLEMVALRERVRNEVEAQYNALSESYRNYLLDVVNTYHNLSEHSYNGFVSFLTDDVYSWLNRQEGKGDIKEMVRTALESLHDLH